MPPGGSAELWLRDEELTGTGGGDPPIGANGIAHHPRRGGSIFVANSEKAQVVEVPIQPGDGSAGVPRVVVTLGEPTAENPFAGVVDGLAVDACGNLYPLLIGESRLVRISPDGSEMETLATRGDGLQTPTSLAFGSGKDARSVFIAEAALFTEERDPKVVKVDVGIPGAGGR